MKLYILKLKPAARKLVPSYDIVEACIVRAPSAYQARNIADRGAMDEGHIRVGGVSLVFIWLEAEYSTCRKLKATGKVGVVMQETI